MSAPLPRHVEPILDALLASLPAVSLVGPRAVGKTTLAAARAATTLRFDIPAIAASARLDPDAALSGLPEPVLLDEWQIVPEILPALKRAVDADPSPGRFLLTGSVSASDQPSWAGTGRLVELPMWGMSVAELEGHGESPTLLDRVLAGPVRAADFERSSYGIGDYLELAMRSGFPQAAQAPAGVARTAWLGSYLDQLVLRDVAALGPRNPTLLRRYLEVLATNSAGVVTQATLINAAGVNRETALGYDDDLARTFIAQSVPPWFTNRLSRLAKLPKRYLTDAALIPAALRLEQQTVLRDTDLLGRLLDTFVASQLRIQADLRLPGPRLHHIRDRDGRREVDLLLETSVGLIAVEVKASATPARRDARHLVWLMEQLGDTVALGIVFSAGPQPIQLADRIIALPISALWEAP